jgi:hypothetical protein
MKTISCLIAVSVLITSCIDIGGFAVKKNIINEYYYLIATDDPDDLSLDYSADKGDSDFGTVIGATVLAIGFNDKYIIVKQHPKTIEDTPHKKTINYYILPLKEGMNWSNNNGLIGPLTIDIFNEKRKELNIENIKFIDY